MDYNTLIRSLCENLFIACIGGHGPDAGGFFHFFHRF